MSSAILNLSPEQREALFNATGMPLRRLGIDVSSGVARAIDRHCTRCLLAEDLPGVQIGPTGLCSDCVEFEVESAQGFYAPERLLEVVSTYRGAGTPDSVLAFSGGKDSALALWLAVNELKLKPVAVLVDNGFIPDAVKENGRALCARFGVDLVIETIDIRRAARESLQSTDGKIPCTSCIGGVFAAMAKTCRARNLRLILSGHRFPPLAYPVSAFTKRNEDNAFMCASPLLSRRMSESEQLALIRAAGWHSVAIAGNTSNCKLIGVVEQHLYDVYGYNPHIFEVSKEIRAGFYDRRVGFRKVERPRIAPEHLHWVQSRMEDKLADAREAADTPRGPDASDVLPR
ncbi:adenine nucleotide alpha hydrolase [Pandoraea terrae]|uniref:Adenine nucleotide alpha hydrolase n=1 Tax=Pandoraea terrae TaxID=1537710 RepID=A0A5E4SFJ0_9BURK|nr:adenine nucleotide alpha hydrolase [Pandoraea terrae]VVD74420.1 adenine nucleotide alpha hydrolase [Pandoraea terrae]